MTSPLYIAIAQTATRDLDIQSNLQSHIELIIQASMAGAELVVFPELSLTGYVLPELSSFSLTEGDDTLVQLSKVAHRYAIDVIIGGPLQANCDKPAIGAARLSRHGHIDYYRKQYLHQGENEWCSSGRKSFVFELNGLKLALAICADFCHPQHAVDAVKLGADVYSVSALISSAGYDADAAMLSNIARQHAIPVVLSNHVGQTGGWQCAGRSAAWDGNGRQVAMAESDQQGLLIVRIDGRMVIPVQIDDENSETLSEIG